MILASYRADTRSSGRVDILRDIETDVKGRDVLIIDDILELGRNAGIRQGSPGRARRQAAY